MLSLCESELNVIVNDIDGTDTQRKFCVDYFIDINNKSVELDSLDIIRAYAFKEDFSRMTERWVKIQKKCNDLSGKVKYTREDLYFQYFICRVNKEIEYKINKLLKLPTSKSCLYARKIKKKLIFISYVDNKKAPKSGII